MAVKGTRGPVVWPFALTVVGVVLLLDNFLLLEPFEVRTLWPLLLVVAGGVILLKGDFLPDDTSSSFSITRGSVASADLEINAGEIDVRVRDLTREGRLIAGQYAANARPSLTATDTHTYLRLDRAATPWLTFVDWDMALATDLPWRILVSTNFGQVDMDLANIITDGGVVATGLGDIRIVAPQETLAPLKLHSAIGSIQVITPVGYQTRITVDGAPTLTIRVDERRYAQTAPNRYIARDAAPENAIVDLSISGTFGDVYLA